MASLESLVPGTVYLVGAGPGDPDLLTLRAARLIGQARLIVHDGLVDRSILALARADAELISVAKQRSRHSMKQEAINSLLVGEALSGRDVVRLKGGDPFIFGRGGEEMEACREAGVPCQIVPGISAAVGGGASAQLPLTHRDHASIVSFVAGQCKGLSDQNWAGLAGAGRTLVIYMGLATSHDIAEKLMNDGLSPLTPIAIIEKATRPDQRVVRSLLADLGNLVRREHIVSPALIVVGEVATLAHATNGLPQAISSSMGAFSS